jgi:outer membrane protein TolC
MRTILLAALLTSATAHAGKGAGVMQVPLPDSWSIDASGASADVPWWDAIGDPGLTAAIQDALDANHDIGAAKARIRQADALAFQNLSALLPRLSFDTSLSGQSAEAFAARLGFLEADDLPDFTYSGSSQFNAALGLDLFGASTLNYQAAKQDKLASIDDQAELSLFTAQRVATAWLDLALATERLRLLDEQVGINEQLLELTELRFSRGEGTAVDVLQHRQQLEATRASIPLVEAGRLISLQQLAVLTGRTPDQPPAMLPVGLPAIPAAVGLGSPSDLEAARPDLRASERRLTSSWQRRMSSERAFLPTFGLSFGAGWTFANTQRINFGGGGGLDFPILFDNAFTELQRSIADGDDADFSNITDGATLPPTPTTVEFDSVFAWNVGAQISVPIFDGGLTIGRLRQARAAEAAAAHTLEQTKLNAMQEVETARASTIGQRDRMTAVQSQADSARKAFETARDRYADGIGDYLTLLSTLLSSQSADLTVLQSWRDTLGADIQLRDALGGSWTKTLGGSR